MVLVFSYSLDLEGAEYTFVHFVQKIEYFKSLYLNSFEFPFTNCVYNPFYPYFIWLIVKLARLDFVKDIHAIFIIGRSISFVFVFIQIFYLVKFIHLFEKNKTIVLLGVLLYLLLITGHFYAMRPDAIVTALFSVFVYNTVVYFYQKPNQEYWFKAAILLILITLLKQDFIIHVFLFLGILFLLKRTKTSFYMLVFSVSLVVFTYVVLFVIFGEAYLYNTVLFNFQVTSNVRESYNLVTVAISICRILPLLVFSVIFYRKHASHHNKDLLLLFLACGFFEFIICHLLMFRAGSFINYSYVAILYLIIGCSIVLQISSINKYFFLIILLGYLFGIIGTNLLLKNYAFSFSALKNEKIEYQQKLQSRNELLNYVGKDLLFMPYPKNCIFLFSPNLIYGYDFHIDRYLYLVTGFASSTKLAYVKSDKYDSYFNSGKLKYILLENNRKNEAYIQQYYPTYKLTDTINIYQVFSFVGNQNLK